MRTTQAQPAATVLAVCQIVVGLSGIAFGAVPGLLQRWEGDTDAVVFLRLVSYERWYVAPTIFLTAVAVVLLLEIPRRRLDRTSAD